MDIKGYIEQKREIQSLLLQFLDNKEDSETDLYTLLKRLKITEDLIEFKAFLTLISKISINHHRNPTFYEKIEEVLQHFESEIKTTFSNTEIYDLFECDKRILYLLFEKQFILPEKSIIKTLYKRCEKEGHKFILYFSSFIKDFVSDGKKKMIEHKLSKFDSSIINNFSNLCKTGENNDYLCTLIQNDSIEEFISHVNKTNLPLSSQIKNSIFETNSFLLDKNPTLIEYASFYGSIQIIQYLKMNKVELSPSMWLYAVHSMNADLIHFLEENRVIPNDEKYIEVYLESIKCHHNDIANYILSNFIDEKNYLEKCNEIISNAFQFYNYSGFQDELFNEDSMKNHILLCACKYNYFKIVDFIFKSSKFNHNELISILFFFKIKF